MLHPLTGAQVGLQVQYGSELCCLSWQVIGPHGSWIPLIIPGGHIAVLAGHTLERATCGLVKAAVHRVVCASIKLTDPLSQSLVWYMHAIRPAASAKPAVQKGICIQIKWVSECAFFLSMETGYDQAASMKAIMSTSMQCAMHVLLVTCLAITVALCPGACSLRPAICPFACQDSL